MKRIWIQIFIDFRVKIRRSWIVSGSASSGIVHNSGIVLVVLHTLNFILCRWHLVWILPGIYLSILLILVRLLWESAGIILSKRHVSVVATLRLRMVTSEVSIIWREINRLSLAVLSTVLSSDRSWTLKRKWGVAVRAYDFFIEILSCMIQMIRLIVRLDWWCDLITSHQRSIQIIRVIGSHDFSGMMTDRIVGSGSWPIVFID